MSANTTEMKIGDMDENGWVLVTPKSALTGTPMWLFLENIENMTWREGADYMLSLKEFHGYPPSEHQAIWGNFLATRSRQDDGGARRCTQAEGHQVEKLLVDFPAYRKKLLEKSPPIQDDPYYNAVYMPLSEGTRNDGAWFQSLNWIGQQCVLNKNLKGPLVMVRTTGPYPKLS